MIKFLFLSDYFYEKSKVKFFMAILMKLRKLINFILNFYYQLLFYNFHFYILMEKI